MIIVMIIVMIINIMIINVVNIGTPINFKKTYAINPSTKNTTVIWMRHNKANIIFSIIFQLINFISKSKKL